MRGQMTDSLSLEEMLAVMREVGMASEDFMAGYEDGFRNNLLPGQWTMAYRRGVEAADRAKERGAHGRG